MRCLSYRLINIHRNFTSADLLCDKASLRNIVVFSRLFWPFILAFWKLIYYCPRLPTMNWTLVRGSAYQLGPAILFIYLFIYFILFFFIFSPFVSFFSTSLFIIRSLNMCQWSSSVPDMLYCPQEQFKSSMSHFLMRVNTGKKIWPTWYGFCHFELRIPRRSNFNFSHRVVT
jgi:hypothetical protein